MSVRLQAALAAFKAYDTDGSGYLEDAELVGLGGGVESYKSQQ